MKNKAFTIVVADDDLDDQHIIQQAIKELQMNHTLTFVKNGLELIDLLYKKGRYLEDQAPKPDVLIMDLNMPMMDGYGVLKNIKAHEDLKVIPAYILSNSRFEYDRRKSLELGAEEFFSKPYHFDDLREIIKQICSRHMQAKDANTFL
jgi:two-component system response regulator